MYCKRCSGKPLWKATWNQGILFTVNDDIEGAHGKVAWGISEGIGHGSRAKVEDIPWDIAANGAEASRVIHSCGRHPGCGNRCDALGDAQNDIIGAVGDDRVNIVDSDC